MTGDSEVRAEDALHKGILCWLYENRWEELRGIQREAIHAFQSSDSDLILTARTAGGKTEAAFLPILSSIADDVHGGVRALYVGPLRALINDQFRRLEDLCKYLNVPVHRWHGEVGVAARKRLTQEPSGILLITPESIESLFLNRSPHLPNLFSRLEVCVIDELHVFLGTERGQHMRSLLARLEAVRGRRIRRIGLSATLARPEEAAAWMCREDPGRVAILSDDSRGSEFKTQILGYRSQSTEEDDERFSEIANEGALVDDLVRHHESGTALVFANSRRQVEETATETREWYDKHGWRTDRILVHHGSVGRLLREDAEEALQKGGDKLCFCTSTLELGLDIGDVSAVAHVGAPFQAASAAQRIGRSGRRPGAPVVFRQYVALDPSRKEIDEAALFFPLLRAVAVIECYLDGWVEPVELNRFHLSTFVHQVICTVAQHDGCAPEHLFQLLCSENNFGWISKTSFMRLLRSMGKNELLRQMEDGTLLLDREGEHWIGSREIYAVFQSTEDWSVEHQGARIGTIPLKNVLMPGDKLLLAGRKWRVVGAHDDSHVLDVEPAAHGRPAVYGGDPGDVHPELLTRMRRTLENASAPPSFCDPSARALIALAGERYTDSVEGRRCTASDGATLLWTWAGTVINRTITALLRMELSDVECDYGHASVEVACVPERLEEALSKLIARDDPTRDLIRFLSQAPGLTRTEKFDDYLPTEDLAVQHVHDMFDVNGAMNWLKS